jgi:hypothetical protein
MGNVFSGNRCSKVNVEHLNQTGFDNFTEVSSVKRDARIEKVSDESFGKASNLLKVEDVDQTMVSNDSGMLKKKRVIMHF